MVCAAAKGFLEQHSGLPEIVLQDGGRDTLRPVSLGFVHPVGQEVRGALGRLNLGMTGQRTNHGKARVERQRSQLGGIAQISRRPGRSEGCLGQRQGCRKPARRRPSRNPARCAHNGRSSGPYCDRGAYRSSGGSQRARVPWTRRSGGDHVAAGSFGGLSRSVSRLSETPSAAAFTESRARWA